ncbi:Aminopeptidase I zinc metalloprotease [Pleurostoma richardsiae]|uniref:Aminopeptidase I zinc metalloprotease n=1 Tax=Pleurostoma richardsiae TaxID=41990 RepID=A0AA38RF41_9PEZI|nr:Aminopeptidase I zinc metalloprotease [Pleurostoma richardsiae]
MTKHTPEFLRARSSNLSLRSVAMESSFTSRAASRCHEAPSRKTAEPEMSAEAQCFVLADMWGRTAGENPVCGRCALRLQADQRSHTAAADSASCRICAFTATKPEVFTKPFCEFLTENPTIFHTVEYFKAKLAAVGFKELPMRDDWTDKLEASGKYFVTRNSSSVIAFTVGKAYKPGNGVAMIAGHIDALTAKLKPVSTKPTKAGYIQLGVAPYAGALNETWWDRDLSIGGRVIVRDPETGKTGTKLVKLGWPIARVPTLAPHFGLPIMGSNNKETQAVPIIGLESSSSESELAPLGEPGSFVATQPPKLVKLIASELGIADYSAIVNWELELFDGQPATVGGLDKEFIFAGRIDDKLCSWAALTGLLHAESRESDGIIKLVALFDDEEIGSLLRQGARANFLPLVIERAVEALSGPGAFGPGVVGRTYARSFLVSADVCHAANPNFLDRYLDGHAPRLNVGVAVCADSNGHMTTDSIGSAVADRVAALSGCTNQVFMIRNDSRSGGTVGPTLSSAMGVKAIDAGLPQLSMHSIRATTGALDPGLGVKFFKGFLDNWEKIDGEWEH